MIVLDKVAYSALRRNGEQASVFEDLSAELPVNSAFGILGPQRSGKTTLMRLLAGFAKPDKGEIRRYARLSFPIGYDGIFKRTLTPRHNLARFGDLGGISREEIIKYVDTQAELGECLDLPLGDLPNDKQMAFVFVASYALPFDCYLIDERYAPGDPVLKLKCQHMLEERAREGGIIFATRRPAVVRRFCNSVGVLVDGKLTVYESVEKGIEAYETLELREDDGRTASNGKNDQSMYDDTDGSSATSDEDNAIRHRTEVP